MAMVQAYRRIAGGSAVVADSVRFTTCWRHFSSAFREESDMFGPIQVPSNKEARIIGLQANAPTVFSLLLTEPQPEVRASAVFALGTLLDVGFDSSRDVGDDERDDDEKVGAEISIVKSLLNVVLDGSPLVRAEVAVGQAVSKFCAKYLHKQVLKHELAYVVGDIGTAAQKSFLRSGSL